MGLTLLERRMEGSRDMPTPLNANANFEKFCGHETPICSSVNVMSLRRIAFTLDISWLGEQLLCISGTISHILLKQTTSINKYAQLPN